MSLYYCSSCADTIPLHKPRINCIDCRFHNVCANCYVLSVYTGQHVRAHTTRVIPKSGKVLPPPLPARHSSTTIPQSQPQGRPEVGRRPVGGPQIQQQTPQYASQPVPLPYSHPTGNPNRMSYIPPQPVPSPATEGTWNQGGPSNRISQNIQLAHQPGPPLVYSQEGYNTALGSRQPLQYIPPPPQGTPPNAVGVHGWDQAGPSHQIQQYTLQPTAPPQQTTPPPIVGTSVGNVEQIPQYESQPTPPPAQTTPSAATEQVYKPHQYAPHVIKGAANENISATTQEAAQVPTQFTSAGQEPNLVQDLPNSNTQKMTNTNPANSQPSQAIPLVATAEPPENTKNQGTLSVARTESIYGTPQPGALTTSGTPIYNQTHQHATPQTAREEPKYTVPQPERLGTTANVDRRLPRATLPIINPDPLPTTTSWSPIFEGCVPSATGAAFLNTVFDCLDVERKGLITPEQWSAFNDVQGYELHEDPWKQFNVPQFGHNGEDLADYEFRAVLKNFSIDHVLKKRVTAPNNDMKSFLSGIPGLSSSFANLMSQHKSSSLLDPPASGGMPLLTRSGFLDITTIEMLGEPSTAWRNFNRIARHYNIWREWGDCPREMFPDETPKPVRERITRATAVGKRRAEEVIEAARVQAEIQAQGREAALRITDPAGTRYVYRY